MRNFLRNDKWKLLQMRFCSFKFDCIRSSLSAKSGDFVSQITVIGLHFDHQSSLYHSNYITSLVIKIAIKMQLSEWIRDFLGKSNFAKIVNVSSGFHSYRSNSIKNSHDLHIRGRIFRSIHITKLLDVRWLQIGNIIKIANPMRKRHE